MSITRKRVAKRLASGLLAGALALGGLAISGGSVSAKTPTSPTTQRVSGPDRYATSVATARGVLGVTNPTDGLVIASGESPYDALAAASLTTDNRPLLLVKKDSIPESVSDFLSDYKAVWATGTPRIYIVGGESAISADVLTAITAAVTTAGDTTPPTVVRVAGADRYATAKAINDVAGITSAGDTLIIVNGENDKWADALSAGAISTTAAGLNNTWPIVVTDSTGLQASAKASVDAYLALPGSQKKVLIVGGPASVSSAVEEYLIGTKAVPPANIRRIAGADRYQTSLLVNVWMLDNGVLGGNRVTLVSGLAPWDALGAAGWARKQASHIQLVDATGANESVLTLSGTLAAFAHAGAPGFGDELWILGGKSAVSDVAKATYIAASTSGNLTSTVTDCVVGHDTITVTMSGRLTAAENAAFTANGADWEIQVKRNNAALAAADVDIAAVELPGAPTRLVYTIDIDATNAGGAKKIQIGDVISWGGMIEGLTVSAFTPDRTVLGGSCTATRDVTPPSVTMRAIPGSDAGTGTAGSAVFLLTSNEPISVSVPAGDLDNTTAGTDNDTALVVSAGSALAGTKSYILEIDAAEGNLGATTALDVMSLAKGTITDIAGLSPLVDVTTTAAADAVGATLTPAGITCVEAGANGTAEFVRNNLTVAAVSGGTYAGAVGNEFSMTVVNQRGLLMPSIVIDATAKTIVVTADVNYHTAADVEMAALNNGLESANLGDWDVTSAGNGSFTATLTPVRTSTANNTAGISDCTMLLVADEQVSIGTGITVTVGGYGAPFITTAAAVLGAQAHVAATPALGKGTAKIVTFSTTVRGSGVLTFTATTQGAVDTSGNNSLNPVTFTVS